MCVVDSTVESIDQYGACSFPDRSRDIFTCRRGLSRCCGCSCGRFAYILGITSFSLNICASVLLEDRISLEVLYGARHVGKGD